jgi:enhancer of polycomb-like protein
LHIFQEHHLQRALSAQQVYGTAESLTIPIPDVDDTSERYDGLYPSDFKQPKQFIHLQGIDFLCLLSTF